LCGDQFTIADYFGACLVSLGETIMIDFSTYPNVKRWLQSVARLPNWNRVNEAFYSLVKSSRDGNYVTIP
jgi:glutathione S-transferase